MYALIPSPHQSTFVDKSSSCFQVVIAKILTKFGTIPGLPALQASITGSEQKSPDALSPGLSGNPRTSIGNVLQFTTEPVKVPSSFQESDRNSSLNISSGSQELKANSSETPGETRTERVINSFLQNPIFKDDGQEEIDELVIRPQASVIKSIYPYFVPVLFQMKDGFLVNNVQIFLLICAIKYVPDAIASSFLNIFLLHDRSSTCELGYC